MTRDARRALVLCAGARHGKTRRAGILRTTFRRSPRPFAWAESLRSAGLLRPVDARLQNEVVFGEGDLAGEYNVEFRGIRVAVGVRQYVGAI